MSLDEEQNRIIGPWTATSLVAGSMLGVGIFLTPVEIASHLSSPLLYHGLWLLLGVICWAGALAYAELGTLFPKAGGDYVYLREAYGPSLSFAAGLVIFGAIFTGSIAAMAVALFQYQIPALLSPWLSLDWKSAVFWGMSPTVIGAIGLVFILTLLNVRGFRQSTWLQNAATIIPMIAYILFALWVLFFAAVPEVETPPPPEKLPADDSLYGFAYAFCGIYFAYAGWTQVVYVAGEVKNPRRIIPLSVSAGVVTITLIYFLLNSMFVKTLGYDFLRFSQFAEVGSLSATRVGGDSLGWWFNLLIGVSLLGSLNASVLAGGRVAYAMAGDQAFVSSAAKLSERGVPSVALWLQAAGALIFVLTGSFERILNIVAVAMIAIGALTTSCVYVLRKNRPELERPYKAPPGSALLFIASAMLVIGSMTVGSFQESDWEPLLGLMILPLAWVYGRFRGMG